MAVSRIWAVKGNLGGVLEYAKDKEKTDASLFSEKQYQVLEDVLQYAADEEKTEHRFYVEGVNCNPSTARQQFINVKKQFDKENGIQAWHGYLSFDQNEVTPQLAQMIGKEFVEKIWGERFQAIVTTHLNTKHLHCHFVINSVSFVDGKKLQGEEKAWFLFSKTADDICRKHGLSVIENPTRNLPSKYLTMKERAGIPTRRSMIREAVDRAISCSRSVIAFTEYLHDMGYECNLNSNRKYWTVTAPGWERPMRLYRLGEDYSNERILERLEENAKNPLQIVAYVPPQRTPSYHLPSWGDRMLRESKLYRKYLYYCYRLGTIPRHRKVEPLSVPPAMRDELLIAERISEEARILCREKLSTTEEVAAYKERCEKQRDKLSGIRKDLRNETKRKNVTEERKEKITAEIEELSGELKKLRKEITLCGDIIKRSDAIERKIDLTLKSEKKREERDHEHER